jgi:hypothetical protein
MKESIDKQADEALVERARDLFDESVAGLDAETRSRLNRSRQRALAEIGRGRPAWIRWSPAFGATAAAVIAVVLITATPPMDLAEAPSSASDLDLLLDEESLEMLEDLEFYSWIELEEHASPEGPENHVG